MDFADSESDVMINWIFFPRSAPPPDFGRNLVKAFEEAAEDIDSASKTRQTSNEVLRKLLPSLENLGFTVESGKTKDAKIHIPVLFGRKGKVRKSFNADAYCIDEGWVLEVEAGRAVDNNQFLKDIFQACMMHDVTHLAIAVRNDYRGSDDFGKIEMFLETLYASGRMQLPLAGILLIGY